MRREDGTQPGRIGRRGWGITHETYPDSFRRAAQDHSAPLCKLRWIFAVLCDVLRFPVRPAMKSLLRLLLALATWHIAAPARLHAEEDWQAAGRALFQSYADAMQGKNYSVFISNCETKSRSLFREFTLWQMDLMTNDDLMGVLPYTADGQPIPLKSLIALSDTDFWTIYTDWMRKREMAIADKARALQGQSGLPLYQMKVLTKYEDTIYMIAGRTYEKPSPVPVPLTVLEAVQEGGKWKLKIPREIIWDALESGRARTAEIEKEMKSKPYDVRPPLKPPVDTPLPAASAVPTK